MIPNTSPFKFLDFWIFQYINPEKTSPFKDSGRSPSQNPNKKPRSQTRPRFSLQKFIPTRFTRPFFCHLHQRDHASFLCSLDLGFFHSNAWRGSWTNSFGTFLLHRRLKIYLQITNFHECLANIFFELKI
jgi:hypothetical protein